MLFCEACVQPGFYASSVLACTHHLCFSALLHLMPSTASSLGPNALPPTPPELAQLRQHVACRAPASALPLPAAKPCDPPCDPPSDPPCDPKLSSRTLPERCVSLACGEEPPAVRTSVLLVRLYCRNKSATNSNKADLPTSWRHAAAVGVLGGSLGAVLAAGRAGSVQLPPTQQRDMLCSAGHCAQQPPICSKKASIVSAQKVQQAYGM